MKILSIFVAFLENTNFNYRLRLEFQGEHLQGSGLTMCICRLRLEFKVAHSNWNVLGYYVYSADLNPIPNQLGHVTYNERADSALSW